MLIFLVIIFLPVINNLSERTIYEIIGSFLPRIFHTVTIAGFFAVAVGWYNSFFLSGGQLIYLTGSTKSILFTFSIMMVTLMISFTYFLRVVS